MYKIHIFDTRTQKDWWEVFESYYRYNYRKNRLIFSKKLIILSTYEEK